MKKFITNYGAYIIIAIMLIALIPGISNRISHEKDNKNVVISLLYNDIRNKLSNEEMDEYIKEYKDAGINTISIMEDDISALTLRGEISSVKYNVLSQRYDEESKGIARFIASSCPNVNYESHIFIAKDPHTKEKLRYAIPRKFGENDYTFAGTYNDMDIYVFYDGRKNLWDFAISYDENDIKRFADEGFNIVLVHKVKNYANTEYLEDIDRIVKEYNIEYLNIKEDSYEYDEEDINKENYKGLAKIINNNDMTLVVTENTDQLSNQKCLGYAHIFNATMDDYDGTKKVIRAYETYDDTQVDESFYEYRTIQYFNSTIDRNIRLITVTQVAPKNVSYKDCSEYTLKAVKLYKEKIENLGFTVNEKTSPIDYSAQRRLNSGLCAVIMVMCLLIMWQMITGKKSFILAIIAFIIAFFGFAISFIMPSALLSLYPSAFCVIQSCFAITAVLYFIKTRKNLSLPVLTIGALVLMLGTLLLGAIGMGTMLSGINYYINNEIFRGIKLSLLIPVFYSTVLFYFLYVKKEDSKLLYDIKKVFLADIKVYWVIIGGIVGAIGIYYIIRSGNVNKISGFEQAMRTTITEIFPARPRTKEFLIGYPALILLVYYMKNTDYTLLKWLLAIASSILAASVTNSFCHVFTDFSVIVSRTLNGLLVGLIVSVIAYIANIFFIKLICAIKKSLQDTEMK